MNEGEVEVYWPHNLEIRTDKTSLRKSRYSSTSQISEGVSQMLNSQDPLEHPYGATHPLPHFKTQLQNIPPRHLTGTT